MEPRPAGGGVRVFDITAPLRKDLPTWPGELGLRRALRSDLERGDPVTVSELTLGSHTGTHIDAPSHFIAGGRTISDIDLDYLLGDAFVVDVTSARGHVSAADLEATVPAGVERLLLKTTNSGWSARDTSFRSDYVACDPSAATWCSDRNIRLIGIDYLSVEPPDSTSHEVHKTLLEAGIVILEGIDLKGIPPGRYTLIALPLNVPTGEGSPTRAILIEPAIGLQVGVDRRS
jgi:arylformamidase